MTIEDDGLITQWVSVQYDEQRSFTETYGYAGSQGFVHLDGILMRPPRPSKTLLFFMHPVTAIHVLPVPRSLAKLGFHVLCGQNRYSRNDTSLIFEKVLLDYGAFLRHAREKLGYEKVVLVGWSGGGPLACFYQAQAENPSITQTPAGDPIDIKGAGLIPADAVVFQAGSISRARILAEAIDPSVRNEADPSDRDPALDLYDPANPNRRPYDPAYIELYRDAQLRRMRTITAWVKETLDGLRRKGGSDMERCFLTHRTMADPRFVDQTVDPNERAANICVSGVPETVNTGPVGFARFSTLRSWLSQWSIDDSQADAQVCAAGISKPFLAIENGADEAAPPSHMRAVFAACGSGDKHYHLIPQATHYYARQPELVAHAASTTRDWLTARRLGSDE